MLGVRLWAESAEEVILAFEGVIDEEAKQIYRDGLTQLAQASQERATVDLTKATARGVAFIGPLLVARRTLADQGRELRIKGCSEELFGTLYLTKLHEVIRVLDPPQIDALPWGWHTPGELVDELARRLVQRECRKCPLRVGADPPVQAEGGAGDGEASPQATGGASASSGSA